MAKIETKEHVLSEEDLAAMIEAEDEYLRMRQKQTAKPPTKDIFYAGFHFGVAHARKAMAQGTPSPAREVVHAVIDEDVDDGD